MDTWNFAYGANANVNLSFGLSFSTDIRMSSRRGYSDASMNTNELLWNAQIAQSFLKNKAATLSIQFYDILQKQSNVSRMISATQRTDSWNNAINSYFMVHFIYKLNIFPGGSSKKGDDKTDRPGPPDMRGPGGMPMRPMGARAAVWADVSNSIFEHLLMAQPFARYGKLVAPFVCGNYGVLMKHCVTLQP